MFRAIAAPLPDPNVHVMYQTWGLREMRKQVRIWLRQPQSFQTGRRPSNRSRHSRISRFVQSPFLQRGLMARMQNTDRRRGHGRLENYLLAMRDAAVTGGSLNDGLVGAIPGSGQRQSG